MQGFLGIHAYFTGQEFCNRSIHVAPAPCDFAERRGQFLGGTVFGEITGCAGFEGTRDVMMFGVRAKDQNGEAVMPHADFLENF